MTKKEFVGYCSCDWRYKQLQDKIKHADIKTVKDIYYIHTNFKNNPKYFELNTLFKARLGDI